MFRRAAGVLLTAAVALLAAGCGRTASPPTAAAAPTSAGASCPAPAPGTLAWPDGVPADLPKPPGASFTSSTVTAGGLTVVRFSTADSLRNGVLHLVQTLQPAGFTLGRGDAEAAEADAPFTRGDLRGVYRMISRQPCTTDWLLALTTAPDAGDAPLLPTLSGEASGSPLPFG